MPNYMLSPKKTKITPNTAQFLNACAAGDIDKMKLCLSRGASVTMPDAGKNKPMAVALDNNQVDAMRFLLENGCPPDIMYITEPMLHWAFYKANREAVDLLLEAGAAPALLEKDTYTIIDPAVRGQDEVLINNALRLLFDRGFDMQQLYDEGLNAAVQADNIALARKFLIRGAHIDSAGPQYILGFPPLVKAVRYKFRKMADFLVRSGAQAGLYLPEVQEFLEKEDGDDDE